MLLIDGLGDTRGRMITLELDAAGEVIRYTENRGDYRRKSPTDTLGTRTAIMIQWPAKVALLVNEWGGAPAEYFTTSASKSLTAESLGRPADVIAKVLKECGDQP